MFRARERLFKNALRLTSCRQRHPVIILTLVLNISGSRQLTMFSSILILNCFIFSIKTNIKNNNQINFSILNSLVHGSHSSENSIKYSNQIKSPAIDLLLFFFLISSSSPRMKIKWNKIKNKNEIYLKRLNVYTDNRNSYFVFIFIFIFAYHSLFTKRYTYKR